jgi:hypothetical protein
MARNKKKSLMTPKASRRKARKRLSTTTGRVKKEFTYRGYSIEELSNLPLFPPEEDPSAVSIVVRWSVASLKRMNTSSAEFVVQTVRQFVRTAEICLFFLNLLVRLSQSIVDRHSFLLKSSQK